MINEEFDMEFFDQQLANFMEEAKAIKNPYDISFTLNRGRITIPDNYPKDWIDIYFDKGIWLGGESIRLTRDDIPLTFKVIREVADNASRKEYLEMEDKKIKTMKNILDYIKSQNTGEKK